MSRVYRLFPRRRGPVLPIGPVVDSSTPAVTSVPSSSTSATTASFTPPAGSVLFLFVSVDGSASSTQSVTSVTNTGTSLNWTRLAQSNAKSVGVLGGTAEIWYAPNPYIQGAITVTANFAISTGGSTTPDGLLQAVVFTGAAAVQNGATNTANSTSGTPSVALTTTAPNSWVWATVDNFASATAPTAGSNQNIYSQELDATTLHGWWVQRQNTITYNPQSVTSSVSAPTGVAYNMAAVEVLFGSVPITTVNSAWSEPISQPPINYWKLRNRIRYQLQPGDGAWIKTANAQPVAPAVSAWAEPVNQPLRHRWLKRQQPNYSIRGRFLPTPTTSQTIAGKSNILGFTTDVAAFVHPVNQPLSKRFYAKRQQPPPQDRGQYLPTPTTTQTITGKANVLGFTTDVTAWKHPVEQPQRRNTLKLQRQMPNYWDRGKYLPTPTTVQTITGKASIFSIGGDVSLWGHAPHQPYKRHYVRRQQPNPWDRGRYFPIPTTTQTITGKANIKGFTTDISAWKHPVEQLSKNRIPKRQQPSYIDRGKFFPITFTTTTQTISGKSYISTSTARSISLVLTVPSTLNLTLGIPPALAAALTIETISLSLTVPAVISMSFTIPRALAPTLATSSISMTLTVPAAYSFTLIAN